jgi:myo-inositol-1-phosphate synthase
LLEAKIANDIKDTIIKDERQRNEVVAKQIGLVKEELQDAVKEVKEAVQEVSQSAKSLGGAVIGSASTKKAAREYAKSALNLGGAFVGSAPKIFANLVKLSATSETR